MGPIRAVRNLGNSLGLAWWARVQTNEPNVTYWFGPFLTKRSLSKKLLVFVDDLSAEGSDSISHTFIRCRKAEPLTS
ncbi:MULTISPECIES: DUF1816 domain-containing protein [Prochlorococcus]|uniref:DUF1816 domain-containing protein n=1 Tax=Prochlorococcus TaxID=1218 RepID=UPI000562C1D0|nr:MULTISPECIES: DUF1816 domain-containing protein [Prochlorococcus]